MTLPRRLAIVAACAGWLIIVHMVLLGASAPTVRTIRLALPGWPAGARDMRIAFASDLHTSTPGDTPHRLAATVRTIDRLHPDVVLLGGDFVADVAFARTYRPADSLAPLAALKAPGGVFAILGNHDWTRLPLSFARAFARLGIVDLDNRVARVGPLAVLGVGDVFSHHADVAQALRDWRAVGGVPIVFTHSPDIVPTLPPAIALVFAGHTHCGQVRLPLVGALTAQSRYGTRYGCGVVREGARTTIVSAGLGLSGLPFRLGLGPDLWVVTVGR